MLLRPLRRVKSGQSGMTLLETSLSLLFMGLFFAALFAASQGIDRLTRGYTCRIISSDPDATSPERGCPGQVDEVSADGIGLLKLANQSALRALRDDLLQHAADLTNVAIAFESVEDVDLVDRRKSLESRCLWEKLTPLAGQRFKAERNYLEVKAGSAKIVNPRPDDDSSLLPVPSIRDEGTQFWFIRAGRLIGERSSNGLVQPVQGLQAIDDGFLSVDPPSGSEATSRQELASEPTGTADVLENAPNQNWGLINQVCLYQGPGELNRLHLLSAERGRDLGNASAPFFGRDVGVASRQPQPRLLFYAL